MLMEAVSIGYHPTAVIVAVKRVFGDDGLDFFGDVFDGARACSFAALQRPAATAGAIREARFPIVGDALVGFGLRLAACLATASDEQQDAIATSLDDLRACPLENEIIPFLDLVSNHRLLANPLGQAWIDDYDLGQLARSGAGWFWLFDENGDQRELAKMPWSIDYGRCAFPLDLEQARAVAQLFAQKCDEDPVKVCEPATEIQRRLLQRFASAPG